MTPTPNFDGPRRIRPEEWAGSHRLSAACFGDEDHSVPPEDPREPPRPAPGETYIITAEGQPVSQISIFTTPLSIQGVTVRVGHIGGVCTHPDYRGYGLASQLMHHCTARLVQLGARVVLISGGRGLYRRLGNVDMGTFTSFTLAPNQGMDLSAGVALRPARPADGPLCARLYAAEPVHFERPPGRFTGRFQPHEIGFHAEDWIVERGGQPAAYLLMNVPWDAMDEPGMPVRCIFEYAGSRLALAGGLALAAAQPAIREVQAPIPWQDTDLIHLLAQFAGAPSSTGLPDHTCRVIDLPGLMRDLRPYARARLDPAALRGLRFQQSGPLLAGAGEDRFTLLHGKGRLELDGADLTRLVMGDPQAGSLPPASGTLAEILPALFPLPAFFAGLDYH